MVDNFLRADEDKKGAVLAGLADLGIAVQPVQGSPGLGEVS